MIVKALSIRNPISYLVASGTKTHEFRSWSTEYRGRLYIHSSGKVDDFAIFAEHFSEKALKKINDFAEGKSEKPSWYDAYNDLNEKILDFYDVDNIDEQVKEVKEAVKKKGKFCIYGAIIGYVDLIDVVPTASLESDWNDGDDSGFTWILSGATLFDKPIKNIPGKLRIFEVEI